MAGRAKIARVIKFAKIGLKLLLGIGLKVLSPKMEGFISNVERNGKRCHHFFCIFLEN